MRLIYFFRNKRWELLAGMKANLFSRSFEHKFLTEVHVNVSGDEAVRAHANIC